MCRSRETKGNSKGLFSASRKCCVANPRNAVCIEQRAAAKSKEAQERVFGFFLLLSRLAPVVGLTARYFFSDLVEVLVIQYVRLSRGHS